MKTKKHVLLIWALLCCIPAASFFLFKEKGDELGGYTPKATTSWPVKIDAREYLVSLEPVKVPLKQGKQTLHLEVHEAKGHPLKGMPKIDIIMPMGNETMTAPVEAKKLATPDEFEIETYFSMAGAWQLLVKPTPKADPIQLDFFVDM